MHEPCFRRMFWLGWRPRSPRHGKWGDAARRAMLCAPSEIAGLPAAFVADLVADVLGNVADLKVGFDQCFRGL
jgi:hypothetical protein